MVFNKEDAGKFVALEISNEDLKFLQELLKFETIIQLTFAIDANKDKHDKLIQMMNIFEAYRDIDDCINDFRYSICNNDSNALKNVGVSIKNVVIMTFNSCKLYLSLLTETINSGLPGYMKEQYEILAPDLIVRINKAMLKTYSIEELKGNNQAYGQVKKDLEADNELKFNIPAPKGLN